MYTYRRDLQKDDTVYNLSELSFAVKVIYEDYLNDPTTQSPLDQYVNIVFSNNTNTWLKEKN